MQITHGTFEIEVGENDRSHHATIEIGRDKLRHPVGICRLEHSLLYALSKIVREEFSLFDIKVFYRIGDVWIALMRASEIEGNFHEAMDLGIFVDVVGEPCGNDGHRLRQPTVVIHGSC